MRILFPYREKSHRGFPIVMENYVSRVHTCSKRRNHDPPGFLGGSHKISYCPGHAALVASCGEAARTWRTMTAQELGRSRGKPRETRMHACERARGPHVDDIAHHGHTCSRTYVCTVCTLQAISHLPTYRPTTGRTLHPPGRLYLHRMYKAELYPSARW